MTMELNQSLAINFARRYPQEAAAALETRPTGELVLALTGLPPDAAAAVLSQMSPGASARAVEGLDPAVTAGVLPGLSDRDALMLLRRASSGVRDRILKNTPAERAGALESALRHPPGSAGALMNTRALALPADVTVDEGIKAVRREARRAQDVVFVVERDDTLVGVVTFQALLGAQPKAPLIGLVQEAPHVLRPSDPGLTVARHPGWKAMRTLPVIDRRGKLVGAVHHDDVDSSADEGHGSNSAHTAHALGDLFWTGVGGMIHAFGGAVAPTLRRVEEKGKDQSGRKDTIRGGEPKEPGEE
jgi:Mg/Co/Ni transporter MgtE